MNNKENNKKITNEDYSVEELNCLKEWAEYCAKAVEVMRVNEKRLTVKEFAKLNEQERKELINNLVRKEPVLEVQEYTGASVVFKTLGE